MKYFVRTYTGTGDNKTFTEKPCASLAEAQSTATVSDKIHICRHEEKQSCSLTSK
jgi:hypothetical protein